MTTLYPISLNPSAFYTNLNKKLTLNKFLKPHSISFSVCSFHGNEFQFKYFNGGIRREEKGRRVVKVRLNQFKGGNGGDDNGRVLGNLALAVGLTYLTFTGQLGWVFDTIVNIGLLVVLLPIAGLAAFTWWAGQNIIQSSCPNCGKDVQIFKSAKNDGVQQLCPYCTQPFSMEGNEFVNNNSNQSSAFGETFNGFSSSSKKERASSLPVVDIEAEVTDVE
ncbi:hypothetical protein ACHQM5_002942 [Ranunculus cassubicifolius]